MRARRDGFADFLKMPVHGFGVYVGRDEPGVYPTVGTNGAGQKATGSAYRGWRGLVLLRAQSLVSVPTPSLVQHALQIGLVLGLFGKAVGLGTVEGV